MSYVIMPRRQGVEAAVLQQYRQVNASTLGHLTTQGYLPGLRPRVEQCHMVGNVVTVKLFPPDGAILREALLLSQPGDVLVIDSSADEHCACWGELRNLAGLIKQLAGVVVVGAVTDITALRQQRLPVFSLGISAVTTRSLAERGEINTPLQVLGVAIHPGDLALGDDDGVFMVKAQQATALLPALLLKEQQDRQKRTLFAQRLKAC
ncbi:4-hydroxy-2-oxoglutarate aldolase [Serratia ficaria]|uniref:RraA family protein n=1 Tax=Enterobacterales TaxID=91347 RepID=UPI000F7EE27D|nr:MULTISPECIES: RraA family protein [Enterobacterales]RSV87638.1 RraA family protein [Klebsiella aerogenes]CAI1972071.1 4-hydroxy-2-oxoglutarate aldolase [Serratia ficaria]